MVVGVDTDDSTKPGIEKITDEKVYFDDQGASVVDYKEKLGEYMAKENQKDPLI